ncbi:MAG: colanic acid biosynthesis glycosyltransferase WcaI, partial [Bacteroidota bacterium]|nr:colanic acid biosynthesis glycosyltransferase WcaI [Bacteroidota bacterium]
MTKRLLLFSGNFTPELTGIGKYNGEMIEWLTSRGIECTVVTTYPYYPQWKVQHQYKNKSFWYRKETVYSGTKNNNFTIIRCPHYIPKHPSGFKRILSDFTIFFSEFFVLLILLFRKKYDYVMEVAPPLPGGLLAVIYKKCRKAIFLYHIQDLQIDAAKDLKLVRSGTVLNTLLFLERIIFKNTDIISSISEGMVKKIEHKSNKKAILFPNWADSSFYPIQEETIKADYGILHTDKVIMYSGAIGEKQGLEIILDCAKEFSGKTGIKFVISGSGP